MRGVGSHLLGQALEVGPAVPRPPRAGAGRTAPRPRAPARPTASRRRRAGRRGRRGAGTRADRPRPRATAAWRGIPSARQSRAPAHDGEPAGEHGVLLGVEPVEGGTNTGVEMPISAMIDRPSSRRSASSATDRPQSSEWRRGSEWRVRWSRPCRAKLTPSSARRASSSISSAAGRGRWCPWDRGSHARPAASRRSGTGRRLRAGSRGSGPSRPRCPARS